jgi:hypothetical protein
MEEIAWKRDDTSYLVFPCEKCNQYTYTKTTRKTKKCARCRHLNNIEFVFDKGEVVNGISTAVELVKQKQHEFAIKELGTSPEFRASDDFKVLKPNDWEFSVLDGERDGEFYEKFNQILLELYELYKEFPFYLIELNSEKHGIPIPEVKLLTRLFLKQGKLIKSRETMFTIVKV